MDAADEEVCRKLDALADEIEANHSHAASVLSSLAVAIMDGKQKTRELAHLARVLVEDRR